MNEYKDTITYEEEKLELAFRDNNYECSKAVTKVSAKREFKDGMWKVISCHGCDINELINMYWELNPPTNLVGNELRDVDFYIGSISLGEPINDLTEVLKTASDVCNELKAVNVEKCELIMNIRKCRRTIIRDFGKASEGKTLMEFTTNIVSRSRRYGYGKVYKVLITKPKIINNTLIDRLIREAYRKSLIDCSSKTLSPLNTGRQTIVLGGGASAALIHELSHLLESTSLNKLNIGHKIGPDELYLYDIPHEPTSPTIRLFDDEGVSTIKRTLIENGTVIDYHHTIYTASKFSSKAGSAHGLYRIPNPFHTTLVMKSGDWKDEEIISETKKGFILEGVVATDASRSYIRIVPEIAAYVEGGEIKEYVKLNEVRIPINKFHTLSAIGKNQTLRAGYEGDYLVAEIAPTLKIEGYVS